MVPIEKVTEKPIWQAMLEPASVHGALRHVYTATAAATAAATIIGLSQGDATGIGTAVHQIGDGIASIVAGVTALIPIITAGYAAVSATRKNRMKDLNNDPQIAKVETVPGTEAAKEAATIPGNKVT